MTLNLLFIIKKIILNFTTKKLFILVKNLR